MTDMALPHTEPRAGAPKLDEKPHAATRIVFLVALIAGIGYCAYGLRADISSVGEVVHLGCSPCSASRSPSRSASSS